MDTCVSYLFGYVTYSCLYMQRVVEAAWHLGTRYYYISGTSRQRCWLLVLRWRRRRSSQQQQEREEREANTDAKDTWTGNIARNRGGVGDEKLCVWDSGPVNWVCVGGGRRPALGPRGVLLSGQNRHQNPVPLVDAALRSLGVFVCSMYVHS